MWVCELSFIWGKMRNLAQEIAFQIALRNCSKEVKWKVAQLCPTLCDPVVYSPWNSPGQNTGVGSLSLLQGIFPTQGSIPGLPHCRRILYELTHKGSPRILYLVAYPFSSGSFQPMNWTRFSCIPSRLFTNWAINEAPKEVGEGQYMWFWWRESTWNQAHHFAEDFC